MTAADVEWWARVISFLPILLCSLAGMGLTIWKWQQLRRPTRPAEALQTDLEERLREGHFKEAAALVRDDRTRMSRLVESVFRDGWSTRVPDRVARAAAALGRELEFGLGALGLIATLGPLFGLLGTVVGITLVFERLAASAAAATPQQLAGGIGTALHTTIAGIVVGVLALVLHRYFAAGVDDALEELEEIRLEVTELIDGGAP